MCSEWRRYSDSPAASRAWAFVVNARIRANLRPQLMNKDGWGIERSAAAVALPAHRDHRHDDVAPRVDELDRFLNEFAPHLPEVPVYLTNALPTDVDGVIGKLGEILRDAVLGEVVENSLDTPAHAGLPGSPHDLHVLLRHRLLRQPGGFEGFGSIPVATCHAQHLAAPQRPDWKNCISTSTPLPWPSPDSGQRDDVIAGIDQLVGPDLEPVPHLVDRLDHASRPS